MAGVGLKNMKSGYTYVVGLKNDAAQYWTTAASSGGAWKIEKVLPGTYTLNVFKGVGYTFIYHPMKEIRMTALSLACSV